MKTPHILYRHYHATRANLDAPDMLPMPGDQAASNCAALHVGLDAMSRIQAKRPPQAGCVASYPPMVRRDAETVAHSLFRVLNRHVCEVMDAERRRTERLTLTVRADAVGRHYAQAMLR